MYTYADRMRAVELYIRLGLRVRVAPRPRYPPISSSVRFVNSWSQSTAAAARDTAVILRTASVSCPWLGKTAGNRITVICKTP